jgi:hypothetical protein
VLYLTTGVPERAALWPWQRPAYAGRVGRRREEALAAAALVGLEPVLFRGTPSRRLRADLDRAAADLDHAVRGCGAEALWVPAFEGGHQDHDAANALAAGLAERLPVWEFAAYNFAGGRVNSNRFAGTRGGEIALDATEVEAGANAGRSAALCLGTGKSGMSGPGTKRAGRFRPRLRREAACRPAVSRERFQWVPFRHPRVDFAPSSEVYRDIGGWIGCRASAGRRSRRQCSAIAQAASPGSPIANSRARLTSPRASALSPESPVSVARAISAASCAPQPDGSVRRADGRGFRAEWPRQTRLMPIR